MDKPRYASIIDEFLDSREPDWKDLGLKDAQKSGEEWLSKTHDETDNLLEELAGASKHTAMPPTSKGATLRNRLLEKENAAPRLGSGRTAQARTAGGGDDDASLFAEVTESFEQAAKGGKVEKKHRSDGEILRYVKQLLNQGEAPAKVAARLKKLAELELFNHQIGTRYLQDNAGMIGMAYMEPNTFMDKSNPNYERQASAKTAYGAGGVVSQIRPGDRVTIRTTHGQELTGKAVMYNAQQQCWVLNMGGKHGTPGIADEENIVKVRKSKKVGTVQGCDYCDGPNAAGTHAIGDYWACNKCYEKEKGKKRTAALPGDLGNDDSGFDAETHAKETNAPAEVTPVIFRKWKDTGDVFALFPHDLGSDDPYTCSSYGRVGQHSSADPRGCIQNSTPALPAEYGALKSELESLGCSLKPMSRLQYNAIETRMKKLTQYRASSVPELEGVSDVQSGDNKTAEQSKAEADRLMEQQHYGDEDEEEEKTDDDPRDEYNPDDDPDWGKHEAATSQDCVRQAKAWKAAGITPRAKSVKQVTACADCSYFKKNGGSKSCGLYGLPVVSNAQELAAIVNKLTAGVPAGSKRAALVQIANRLPEQRIPKVAADGKPMMHESSYKAREFGFVEAQHFSGAKIQKLHSEGYSLKVICAASDKKYGPLETSKAVREFVASLRKEKGKIIVAKVDADYLKKIGIHNEAIVGATKCASCKSHSGKELHKAASTEMITRAPETFVQATPGGLRSTKHTSTAHFDSANVEKLHKAGHSVEKIYKAASAKYGMVQASKAVRDWASNLKNTDTKIALSQIDCTTLKKMGVKLSSKNAIVGAAKCGDCNFRNGMHCGLTGGTLLSFPGMNQIASNKKVAAGAPVDGRSILQEFDLMGSAQQADIDMKAPDRADVHMSSILDAGEI